MDETTLQMYQIPNLPKISEINNTDKDPFCVLKEHFGKFSWNTTLMTGVHNKCCFKVNMLIDGKHYSATGTTFMVAKKSCAMTALADLCNVYFNNKSLRHGPVPCVEELMCEDDSSIKEIKSKKNFIKNQEIENRYEECKNKEVKFSNLKQTVEEIKDDLEENLERDKMSKTLQNIINLPATNNSNLEFHKVSNLKNATNEFNLKNSLVLPKLDGMFTKKVKSGHMTKNTHTNKKMSTMDLVNLQTVEMEMCVKTYARNPIENEDLDLKLSYESINQSQIFHQKFTQKRRCRDNSPEVMDQRRLPIECSTACKIPRNKVTPIGNNWSQQNLNPIMIVQQMYPNLEFRLEAEMGSSHAPYFMKTAMIEGRKFFGHGKTMQLAERDAAKQILNHLEKHPIKWHKNCFLKPQAYKRNFRHLALQNNTRNVENSPWQLPSNLADIIEAKIMQRFDQLTRGRQEIREYKVVAGIVMTVNMDIEQATVVSIATGTKCVNGGNICCNGSVLNDSHAEIIARRGLMKFLYTQLKWHCQPDLVEKSIFQRNFNSLQIPYCLKLNVHFHLYINTAPCGDARIFSTNNQYTLNNMSSTTFNSGQCGQLRTKVEGGMGTTPVGMSYYTQTWDGVVLGQPLLTMSCSDKIARWNVVGIQGALLSQLTEPIYLHSIVLGSMFNANHMYRAICGRIQCSLDYLPKPYRLNRPLLGRTSTPLPRNTYRVPSLGINWTLGDNDIEVISLPTGRKIYNEISFLSKQIFFSKFIYLLQNLPDIGGAYMSNNYAEAKRSAKDFQVSKREVFAAFYRADLGNWIKKPIEQNEFTMN